MQVNSIPRILCLTLVLLPTLIFAQPMAPHVRKGVPQEVLLQSKSINCGDIVYSLQVINNGSGCCYRLKADNSNPDNCFVNVALNLDMGAFANFIALPGWQYNTGGPAEYTVRPFMGFIPPGSSSLAEFCIDGTTSATLTLLWEDLCILEGCAATFDVSGCLDPGDASITGVAYLECESLPYSNQVTLPDWTIELLDTMGNVVGVQVTDVNGAYAFYDLPAGVYVVKEIAAPGWSPSVPASGKTTVDLSASEQEVRNFGNCRANCLCSSIQTSVIPLSSTPTECCYNLKTQVLGGGDYCFQYLNVQVDAGQFITSWIPQTGWIFTQINPQSIKISPISGIIPLGTYVPGSICISGNGTHNILVTAGFEDSAGPHECDASYSFNCPPPQNPCACPTGFPGNNLCINGNFSGLGGFTSNYVLNNVGPLLEGQFWVGANPSLINAGFQACGDHTSGSGNMMVVNGATNASTKIWCETITVSANTNYQFGAWIASLAAASPAQLQLFVNNVSVGGSFQASAQPCDWQQYCQSWFSGTNTTATICLVNLNPSASGNDFALDDLSFRACVSISNCVRGTVYVACDSMPFTNQPTLSGWTISLLNSMGVVLDTMVTDSTGAYAFCDLVPGNYVVKTSKPGWTANVPPTGMYAITLGAGGNLNWDFGVCQDVGCSDISFFIENYEPCKYRLNIDNSSECFPFLRLKLDTESHQNWREDTLGGWTAEMLSSTEILLKHNSGHIPLGASTPIQFSITPGISTNLAIIWDISCAPGGSCSDTFPLPGCPANSCQASISVTQGPNCTVQVTAVTAGSQPVSYQWCDGRTDASFTTSQLPCVPTTYCVTATCSDGSISTALVVFTAQDLTPPIAVCNPGVGVDLDANCAFQVTTGFVDGGSTDNCGIMSMSVSPTTLVGCANTIVTLTVTDWCGNTSTCTMGIQTKEEAPPILTCPANTSVTGTNGPNGLCTATYSPTVPVATDNCDPSVTVMNNAPTVLQQGPNTITWTATDDCGNQTVCTQIVTVLCDDCCKDEQAFFVVASAVQTNAIYGNCSLSVNGTGLNNCMRITWDWGDGSPKEGPYTNNTPVSHTYSGYGLYTVCYTITEVNQFGEPCFEAPFCLDKQVGCFVPCPDCQNNLVQNPGFFEGAIEGELGFNGASDHWMAASATPDVSAGIFCCDAFGIQMWGSQDKGEAICQTGFNFMPNKTYSISFSANFSQPSSIVPYVQFGFYAANSCVNPFPNCTGCETMGISVQITDKDCATYTLPNWTPTSSFNTLIVKALTANIWPDLGFGRIDNICIQEVPQGCVCGTFSQIYARPSVGAPSIALSCGGTYDFGCPNSSQSIPITGKFECVGDDCPATSQITWTLTQPSGNNITGTVGAGPYFYLPILPTDYAQPGNYTIVLKGNCGGQECPPCIIKFSINCIADPCPCDDAKFQKDIAKGFATVLWNNSCKACFSPIALNDCDEVQWSVDGGPVIGTTHGNGTFCHIFSGAGTHSVSMTVIRKKGDGSTCAQATITKSVILNCSTWPDCSNSILANPRFSEGMPVAGILGSGGVSSNWKALSGEPKVLQNQPAGTLDGWAMCLSGNLDTADVLSSEMAICVNNDTGTVSIRMAGDPIPGVDVKLGRKPPGGKPSVYLYQGNNLDIHNPNSSYRLASLEGLLPLDSGEWVQVIIPYNLKDWVALNSCGDAPGGIPVRLAVFVSSQIGDEQGDHERYIAQFDNICMDGQLVSVNNPAELRSLRIFPNPNPGTFTVELPEPAKPGTSFRILDLTGRLVQEQKTEPGIAQQVVRAEALPAGLYFLQVVSEGTVLATEKFIKQ